MIEAKMIADSIGSSSPRLLTIRGITPKFIHQETLRHRKIYIEDALRGDPDFSFSVSSARAIPFPKLLAEVESSTHQAKPVKWGTEQKGMSTGDELGPDDRLRADQIWYQAAYQSAQHAKKLVALRVHKSIVNRLIEPYIHVHFLMTATETGWMNFFGLRLDQAADDTLRAFSEECWKVWNESRPKRLTWGEWHLPFLDQINDADSAFEYLSTHGSTDHTVHEDVIKLKLKISVARSAHLSYEDFSTNKPMTIEKCIELHDRFVNSIPIHASPMEHQAQIDTWGHSDKFSGKTGLLIERREGWLHPELSGNLGPGWIQYRKTIPGEGLAPLPERFRT